jgi:hypothetical protein
LYYNTVDSSHLWLLNTWNANGLNWDDL